MENKKITDIQDLIDILASADRNNENFGNFDEKTIRDSVFEKLDEAKIFGEIKRSDIDDWKAGALEGALKIINESNLGNMPKSEALERGQRLAEQNKKDKKTADINAAASVERTINQANEQKKRQDVEKLAEAKKTTKSIVPLTQSQPKQAFFVTPTQTIKLVTVEPILEAKIKEVKADAEFSNKFVEFFSKPENAPEGIDVKTAQLVAATLAADLAINKVPLIEIKNNAAVPLPNPLLAQIALLNNKEVLDKAFGENSNQAFALIAKATAHDGVWYMAEREMVDKFFGTENTKQVSTLMYGDLNQRYEISNKETGPTSFPVDVYQSLDHATQIDQLFKQSPAQASVSIQQAFSEMSFRPDLDQFARNIGGITRGIMETFGGSSSTTEFIGPNMGQVAAMRYLGLMPQLSPELSALMFDQVRLATITFGKVPFAAAGGEIGLNAGLMNGFSVSLTRFGVGQAVATGAGAATTAAEAATAGAGAAAATGAGTTGTAIAGAAAGPVGLVAALGLIIATNFSKIKVWWTRNSGKIGNILLGIGIIPLIAGALTGSIPLLLGGGILAGAGVLGGGTFAGAAAAGWAVGSNIFTGAILPGIAGPLIGTLIGFPLVVALVLFIINSSAYVIPPGTGIGGLETGPVSGQVDVYGSCPLTGEYFISTSSLNGGIGHGSELYWTVGGVPTPPKDRYSIPIWGQFPKSAQYPAGCVDTKCPYYGFAADVAATPANTSPQVITPKICGTQSTCEDLSWNVLSLIPHPFGWGTGVILYATGNGHSYQMYLAHMDSATVVLSSALHGGGPIPSGTVLAPLSSALTHPHVHIELNVDGAPVKPDFLCP